MELVEDARQLIPGVALSTDMITGFCGETEQDHQDSLTLMDEVQFDQAFQFAYSKRDRTHAAYKMDDSVPAETKQQRLQELIDMYRGHVTANNKVWDEGRVHVVLIEGPGRREQQLRGRSDTNKRVVFPDIETPLFSREDPCADTIRLDHHMWKQRFASRWVDGDNTRSESECAVNSPPSYQFDANGPAVKLVPGDYVLVLITDSTSATLHGLPLARCTLQEAASLGLK
jgi:hypothetical protein